MPSPNSISPDRLYRLIGTPNAPAIIDVRAEAAFTANPVLIPGSAWRPHETAPDWASQFAGRSAIVTCAHGHALSEGAAAWLRQLGVPAEILEGGIEAWRAAGLPLLRTGKLPPRDQHGRTIWVTRSRPKIDRIACPWLIRRFVDPLAIFLFVAPSEAGAVAEKFGGVPFDIDGVFWSHRNELCTFDVMLEEFGIGTEPLKHLARIVRAADTARLDLAPEAAGLLAASLGLSRMYADDLEQLEAGMGLYDAFYRWARDATGETHNWPSHSPKRPAHE